MQRTRLSSAVFRCLVLFFVLVLFQLSSIAIIYATTVSLQVDGNEGAIPVEATATFGDTTMPLDGTLTVYRDNKSIGSVGGTGRANWSGTEDGGALSQGPHIYTATACDKLGDCQSSSQTIVIDNTPELTATAAKMEGDMAIGGTVHFKEYVGGAEGIVRVKHIQPTGLTRSRSKYYEGADVINWTWAEMYTEKEGQPDDAGNWKQGEHLVQVTATAYNGTESVTVDLPIHIDNTPEVTAEAQKMEGDMGIHGTVRFKERANGYGGTLKIERRTSAASTILGSKTYPGAETFDWVWAEVYAKSKPDDAGSWPQGDGTKVLAIAEAYNGAQNVFTLPIHIDNTPQVNYQGARYYPDKTFDLHAKLLFKEHVRGDEGRLDFAMTQAEDAGYGGNMTYIVKDTQVNWSYSAMTGRRIPLSLWTGKKIKIKFDLWANNGARNIQEFTEDLELGCPVGEDPACCESNPQGAIQ